MLMEFAENILREVHDTRSLKEPPKATQVEDVSVMLCHYTDDSVSLLAKHQQKIYCCTEVASPSYEFIEEVLVSKKSMYSYKVEIQSDKLVISLYIKPTSTSPTLVSSVALPTYESLRVRVKKLETTVAALIQKIAELEDKIDRKKIKVVREVITLDKMQHIQLHQKKEVREQPFVNPFPEATKILILAVYRFHGNNPTGHAYLDFDVYQKGSDTSKTKAPLKNYSYDNYYNSHYYEVMIPWDTALPNVLVFDITNTYNTGSYGEYGNLNYYDVNVVGYITN